MSEKCDGETDLQKLLENMSPVLNNGEFVFLSFADSKYGDHSNLEPIASFLEAEGLTLVVSREAAESNNHSYDGLFRSITLQIHSSLEAVGLTAAFAQALTKRGISANVIAGFYHDHIFVSTADADNAVSALKALSGRAS